MPERGNDSTIGYYWKVAKAYGSFYRAGIKAISANRKLSKSVMERLKSTAGEQGAQTRGGVAATAFTRGVITRAEYQLLKRNAHDLVRVPLFLVLVLLLGEWLVLIVPFVPYLPPLTCRIPDVVTGMRGKAEQRRSWTFRKGVQQPDTAQITATQQDGSPGPAQVNTDMADLQQSRQIVQKLQPEQLYHISCVLNLHSRAWEGMQLMPPAYMLRGRIAKRLTYLTQDDHLMNKSGNADSLIPDELAIACEERGLDVLHPYEEELRNNLQKWLDKQKEDESSGKALLDMLFNRPNAWR